MNNFYIFIILSFSLQASTARIMTYNLWNFDGEDNSREDDILMVISDINPDIIWAKRNNVTIVSYDKIITDSDIITIHIPGNKKNPIINCAFIYTV